MSSNISVDWGLEDFFIYNSRFAKYNFKTSLGQLGEMLNFLMIEHNVLIDSINFFIIDKEERIHYYTIYNFLYGQSIKLLTL